MTSSIGLVLDCAEPQRLAEFWAPALGYTNLGSAGSYVLLADEHGGRPKLLLQGVPEAKTVKNRMHFDIETRDIEPKPSASKRSAPAESTPSRATSTTPTGSSWPIPKAMSSASATAAPRAEIFRDHLLAGTLNVASSAGA